MNEKNILLTGVTGLVGRHILYELLLENIKGISINKIFVTIRATEQSPYDRLQELFDLGSCPTSLTKFPFEYFLNFIDIINTDLLSDNLEALLKDRLPHDLTVIHSAASTNLASNDAAKADVFDNNMIATFHLLKAVASKTKKVCYLSSSFAIGQKEGVITDDYLTSTNGSSRNHYEQYKLQTEKSVVEFCKSHNMQWQILRPSIVCGRLLEKPYYYMSKFDVFYGFAKCAAFLQNKTNKQSPLRVTCNMVSSLNIVPADYVAKVICKSIHCDIKQLNIVHKNNVNSRLLVSEIFKSVGLAHFKIVSETPSDLTKAERFYYATAGSIFTEYLCSPEQSFDVRELKKIAHDVELPEIQNALPKLLEYAAKCEFDSKNSATQALSIDNENNNSDWKVLIKDIKVNPSEKCPTY
ncbi:SDR family oxidoreductase [Marinicellulosiphila megalodicopiae]|uniref:SDR family oxidoreductase n=1 Tax=Marinicellulosiphila megalodicopiae TaxID=2724896 RepID=UPI003BB11916